MIREGRLGKGFDKEVAAYTSSIEFDTKLFDHDLLNNMAHLVMLHEQGIVESEDTRKILSVLKELHKSGIKGVDLDPGLEDIHMAIEAHIIKEAGEIGGRVHTARSRNDQIACDLRMKTREEVNLLSKAAIGLVIVLLEIAEKNTLTLMPSLTHLQHAQPTTLAHHLLAYVNSLQRSLERLEEAYKRVDLNPLGSGAATTSSFPINRDRTTELLGFEGILKNSMDAVSSRDYMSEIASAAALISVDLSRIAEELILWSTSEFSFIEISDTYASTSSIMPQKKNPDILEIIRARTATTIGSLTTILTMQRSLPQSYNRDLQELSPPFFGCLESVNTSLTLITKVLGTMKLNEDVMRVSSSGDFSTATELADLIVKEKKLPFRTAHQIVGAVVSTAIKEGLSPSEISAEYIDRIAMTTTGVGVGLSEEQVSSALTPLLAVKSRNVLGGPAPEIVERQVQEMFDEVAKKEANLNKREERLRLSKKQLLARVDSILGG
jgi:argininosuccinate lyase